MQRRIALVALAILFTFVSVGAARADELQLTGGIVSFTSASGGVNLGISPFTIQLSDPFGDSAVGSTVSFGTSQPLAYFGVTSGNVASGTINNAPQLFSITGSAGTLTGDIQSVVLTNTTPGIFGLAVTISPITYSAAGTPSDLLNQIYGAGNGGATISFQFSNDNYKTLAGITGLTSGTIYSSASGSVAAVPEPASLMMLGSGLLAIGGLKMRRKTSL
jgi:PEP-CTERM motif